MNPFQQQQIGGHYRAFYNAATNDPFAGSYQNAYDEFDVPLAGNPVNQPAELGNKVFMAAEQGLPMSLVLLTRDDMAIATDPGEIVAYHRVSRFAPRMGLAPTPWDNAGFAFLGDMIQGQAPPTVAWDNSYFHTVQQTRVPTIAALDQTLAAQPNTEMVGPFADGKAGTELVRTRRTMFLPTKYVPLVLDLGLSPKNAWLRIRGSIEANGESAACAPLINWLRVAITCQAANLPSRLATVPPPAPVMQAPAHMATLLSYRWQLVSRDVPALNTAPVALGAQNIAQGLTALVSEQRLARQEDQNRRRADKNKNPCSYFGNDVLRLLRWCHVQDETLLPNVWKQLANAPKGQHRRVIQGAIDDTCERRHLRATRLPKPKLPGNHNRGQEDCRPRMGHARRGRPLDGTPPLHGRIRDGGRRRSPATAQQGERHAVRQRSRPQPGGHTSSTR